MTTHQPAGRDAARAAVRDRVLERVDQRIGALLAAEHRRRAGEGRRAAALVSDVAAVVRSAGDRIRAGLFLTGYLAAGGDPEAAGAVDAAAALEFLDAALAIRADSREGAALRRGLPTLHVSHAAEHERNGWRGDSRRFGDTSAVLAGDLALGYADRLACTLAGAARREWENLRTQRVLGAYETAVAAAAYQDDPWPAGCLALACSPGCAAGAYAVHHPLRLGALLAGRPELAGPYTEYGLRLHAAWRLRGFLSGGPGYDDEAELLRDVLFDAEGRQSAEALTRELGEEATRSLAPAALPPAWHAELVSWATHLGTARCA
jgi:geranylgeranyl diphosphate synthase type I